MPQQQVTSMLGTIYQGVCLRRGGGREEACSQCLWMRGVLVSNSFLSSVEDSLGPIQVQSACTDLVASKLMQSVSCAAIHVHLAPGHIVLQAHSRHHPAPMLCSWHTAPTHNQMLLLPLPMCVPLQIRSSVYTAKTQTPQSSRRSSTRSRSGRKSGTTASRRARPGASQQHSSSSSSRHGRRPA